MNFFRLDEGISWSEWNGFKFDEFRSEPLNELASCEMMESLS